MDDTVDTLVFELGGTTYVALAADIVGFELADHVFHQSSGHALELYLGGIGATQTGTHIRVATSDGELVTFVSAARPRFSVARRRAFFTLPRLVSHACAQWVRGVHLEAEDLAIWIDFRLLADSVVGDATA